MLCYISSSTMSEAREVHLKNKHISLCKYALVNVEIEGGVDVDAFTGVSSQMERTPAAPAPSERLVKRPHLLPQCLSI